MATAIYFPSSGAAAISPALISGWEITTALTRFAGVATPIGSAMTTFQFTDANRDDRDIVAYQYVFGPLAAQTVLAQTIKIQILAQEAHAANVMRVAWAVRFVASDATTFRGTAVALRRDGTDMATAALTNRGDSATSTEVVIQDGYYGVLDLGGGGDPSQQSSGAFDEGHDYRLRIGDAAASDLPEDNTTTTDLRPYLLFANTLTFQGAGGASKVPVIQNSYRQRRVA